MAGSSAAVCGMISRSFNWPRSLGLYRHARDLERALACKATKARVRASGATGPAVGAAGDGGQRLALRDHSQVTSAEQATAASSTSPQRVSRRVASTLDWRTKDGHRTKLSTSIATTIAARTSH